MQCRYKLRRMNIERLKSCARTHITSSEDESIRRMVFIKPKLIPKWLDLYCTMKAFCSGSLQHILFNSIAFYAYKIASHLQKCSYLPHFDLFGTHSTSTEWEWMWLLEKSMGGRWLNIIHYTTNTLVCVLLTHPCTHKWLIAIVR